MDGRFGTAVGIDAVTGNGRRSGSAARVGERVSCNGQFEIRRTDFASNFLSTVRIGTDGRCRRGRNVALGVDGAPLFAKGRSLRNPVA